jgi:hypothetical protein
VGHVRASGKIDACGTRTGLAEGVSRYPFEETNQTCPFRCAFCADRKTAGETPFDRAQGKPALRKAENGDSCKQEDAAGQIEKAR